MNELNQCLVVQYDKNDKEFEEAVTKTFGDSADFIETKSFDAGLIDSVQVIIPIVPALIGFLTAWFTQRQKNLASKRFVITKDGDLSLIGYSQKDIEKIIDGLKR